MLTELERGLMGAVLWEHISGWGVGQTERTVQRGGGELVRFLPALQRAWPGLQGAVPGDSGREEEVSRH